MRKILVEKRELLVENELMLIIVLPNGQIVKETIMWNIYCH